MLWISYANVKEGRQKEFQEWTKKNEKLLQKYAPQGWTYRGTYAYVLGFGRFGVAGMWECEKYGDFDNLRNHEEKNWMRLNEEMFDFFEPSGGEAVLLRELGDTKITEPKKPRP